MKSAKIPLSTYRIQFNKDFRFVDCSDIVPYLHELGAGALYSSPRFRARRGSSHGYDVASALRVNSELGTDEEFDDLCTKLRHYNLEHVLDIVPNHMSASHENPWWMDVLENGPASYYAHYFDIDWRPATSKAAFLQENKLLLPVLGNLYGNVLANGELTLGIDEAGFFLRYYERKIPLDPKSYGLLMDAISERITRDLGPDHPSLAEIDRVREVAQQIPPRTNTSHEDMRARLRGGHDAKHRIFTLYRDNVDVRQAIDATLRDLAANLDRFHQLLTDQAYRLAYWKIAFEEINYRRFFDINDLVCVRVEEEDVLGWDLWRAIDAQHGLGLLEQAVQNAIDAGRLAPQSARAVAHVLLGALDEAAMVVARADDPVAARAEMGKTVRHLLEGLRGPTTG